MRTFRKDTVKILLVEDHPIFRQGLMAILNSEPGLEVVGEAEDAFQGLKAVKEKSPDLVIVDITLKDSSGIELIKDIRLRHPEVLLLTLSMHDETIYAERALRAGARGYIMKQHAPETVVKAIRQVLDGKIFVSEEIANRIFNRFIDNRGDPGSSPVEGLSDRELEVFELIGRGLGTREISEKLHVSVKTVENHRAHIKEKLNLKSAIELVQHATLWVEKK
ncbi:MAG: response regulator transcription factor [Spirochaetes bacterium]|nr:response regulator transcription factor [Spirochaetota bacterium]HPA72012.1 response regulator transcription factor [Spirochaetota bacterium]